MRKDSIKMARKHAGRKGRRAGDEREQTRRKGIGPGREKAEEEQ